ncbi:MAG: hypothetical protein IPH37_01255 [Burkholderiales bacterium]|nr:hypothetical protein [Burkholderiales bacterium]
MAQAVAAREDTNGLQLGLSSNPDVVMEVMEKFRANKHKIIAIAVINKQMPFVPNTAQVEPGFDMVVTDPAGTTPCLPRPTTR